MTPRRALTDSLPSSRARTRIGRSRHPGWRSPGSILVQILATSSLPIAIHPSGMIAIEPNLSTWKDRLPFVPAKAGFARAFGPLFLVGVSLVLSLYRVSDSGPLFADAPRYANGGAMIHDWLRSGDLLDPYRFALKNYAQYPAFSIPYHPPLYPGLLGLVFLATGVSHVAARCFLAICLGGVACCFFSILSEAGDEVAGRPGVYPAADHDAGDRPLVPEHDVGDPRAAVHPGRFESLPGLALVRATVAVLGGIRPGGMAFQCRVTSAGVIPCWFLFAALSGQMRRLFSPHIIAASALYLAVNGSYAVFASQYSQLEMEHQGLPSFPLWFTQISLLHCLRPMQTWGTTPLAMAGLVCVLRLGRGCPPGLFWLCWLVAYLAFMGVVHTHAELRYFIDTMPALAGLAAGLFCEQQPAWVRRRLAPMLLGLGLVLNVSQVVQLPLGVVGYQAVAERLAQHDSPGQCPRRLSGGPGLHLSLSRPGPEITTDHGPLRSVDGHPDVEPTRGSRRHSWSTGPRTSWI